MMNSQSAKQSVRDFTHAFERAADSDLAKIFEQYLSSDYHWRGMYPFFELASAQQVVEAFWRPLRNAFGNLNRREDIFFAGSNDVDNGDTMWTCSMGHFIGLFDRDWLGIPATGRLASLRYAEFHCVNDQGKITQTAMFFDLIGLMHQAGCYPLPPMTGSYFRYPGPATHDGLLLSEQDPGEAEATMALLNRMIADLASINHLDGYKCPPELLAKTWHEDMTWYGPCGIGASYTIARYQAQHQHPFRLNLTDKTYNGHVARLAEGHYCGFFGWANLSNRNTGGFLGMSEAKQSAEMRVVDIYRRDGDKLAENWVIIDLPYYLQQQGLDVLKRLADLRHLPG